MTSLRAQIRTWRRDIRLLRVPKHLRARFVDPGAAIADVDASLKRHYLSRRIWGEAELTVEQWLATPAGQDDLEDHLQRRLQTFRSSVVPWLDAAKPLRNATVLEIGCGTGASTVALAEQGARVTAVDMDEPSLTVARDRCRAYGLQCEFVQANGAQLGELLAERRFDFVIFFACLEHMTLAERIQSMRATWTSLAPGGLWCCIETPNRLWHFDEHTSRLPFFHWLPDDLAFEYARFSEREPLRSAYRNNTEQAMSSFLRHGRGVSFHEFDIAIGDSARLDVVSSLALWRRERRWFGMTSLPRFWQRFWQPKYRYESLIAALRPDIHRGFFQAYLDLIVRKPG